MLFVGVTIVCCLLQAIGTQGNSYDTSCVNHSFCWEWNCRTDQVAECFPNSATVEIRDRQQRVSLRSVHDGDQILVDVDSHGRRIYEPVYTFTHASDTGMYDYLQISVDGLSRAGTIRDIRLIKSHGFYAPLTRSGKLVVDGISVSNYALVANHQLAHLAIQPYRWALSLLGSSSYSDEIHWYCQFLYSVVEQINKWFSSVDLCEGQVIVWQF